jgi:hypothetical protein
MSGKKMAFIITGIVIILIVIFLSVSLFNGLITKDTSSSAVNNKYAMTGYGISIEKGNLNMKDYNIVIDKRGEFSFNVKFINNSGKKGSFLLNIYLNYEQIPFCTYENKYSMDYMFNIGGNTELKIPLKIDINKLSLKNNSLVISFVAGHEKHACDLNEVTDFFGSNAEYNLILPGCSEKTENYYRSVYAKSDYQKININNNFEGIFLNQVFNDYKAFRLPKPSIRCKPGETVKFALRLGGYKDINNYIAWVNLGYRQYPINGKCKYLLFNLENNDLIYKEVSIKAPMDKGKYEVWAFLAKKPLQIELKGRNERHTLDYSHRITLIVG